MISNSKNTGAVDWGVFAKDDTLDALTFSHGGRGGLLRSMLRRYAGATTGVVAAMFGATVAESLGILSLLPLMQAALSGEAGGNGHLLWLQQGIAAAGLSGSFGTILVVVCLGLLIGQALQFFCATYIGWVSSRFASDMRRALIDALALARGDYLLTRPIGVYTALLSTETNRAASAYIATCNMAVHAIAAVVLIGSALLVDWRITVAAVLVGTAMMALLRGFLRMSRESGHRITTQTAALSAQVADGFSAIKPLKAMGEEERLAVIMRQSISALDHAQRRQVLSKSGVVAGQDALVLSALGIGVYVVHGIAGFPFSMLVVLAVLFHRATSMIGQLQKDYQGILNAETGLVRLINAIAAAQKAREVRRGTRIVEFTDAIRFRDVGFSYQDRSILDGINLEVPANSFTVIMGPSGAGKTTLVDLIAGLHEPRVGTISVDDVSFDELSMAHWRKSLGYVPQDPVLFHDTIEHNITLSDTAIAPELIEEAVQRAGAATFIVEQPNGFKTIVGERGGKLSGGQRQRIAIARALVRRPRLLILDEPTAALDPESERALCQTLNEIAQHTTILAISHRPALAEFAHQIVTMENGRIFPSPAVASVAVG
jgi:ATP-binding cassette subfamily C protein